MIYHNMVHSFQASLVLLIIIITFGKTSNHIDLCTFNHGINITETMGIDERKYTVIK